MLRRRAVLGAGVSLALLAALIIPTAAGASHTSTYQVTITNGTGGQPFTPPAAAIHRRSTDLFDVGDRASFEVKEIAENGNLGPMLDALGANRRVFSFAAAGAPDPILPGGSVSFELTGPPRAKFSFVSMLVCTNDGFTGADSIKLPRRVGDTVEMKTEAYDAGTEANTEDLVDIVPPCSGGATGTGMSNPGLAQQGVIAHHPGVLGTGTCDMILDPTVHGWTGTVASVEITRTS